MKMNLPTHLVPLVLLQIATVLCVDEISLNGQWDVYGGGTAAHIVGTVPGSMYTALLEKAIIEDPYYRFNDIEYQDISLGNWIYSRSFQLSQEVVSRKHVLLVLDGVDTVAVVSVNGQLAGMTSNMFVRYSFEIGHLVQAGTNNVTLSFESAVKYAAAAASTYPYHHVPPDCPPPEQHGQCHVNFIRKEQCSFSWDWGPSFPTQGIWKNVTIRAYDSAVLTEVMASVLQGPDGDWSIKVTAFFDDVDSGTSDILVEAQLPELQISNKSSASSSMPSSVELWLHVPGKSVQLWWPNGYGGQQLYSLQIRLTGNGIDVSERNLRVGFRTVELVQEPINGSTGLSFYFKVNGEPIFMKGSNWIPADAFQERVTPDRLRNLLTSAADAHQNMLRVWGGGVYEQDAFYNIADELGIFIWQDFMFSCALYPVDIYFLEAVKQEVIQQVRRLQHHPSIAVWAGNNENEAALRDDWYDAWNHSQELFVKYKQDYVTLYIDNIKATIEQEDPNAIYVSSSPSNGKESEAEGWIANNPYDTHYGDVHFYNYDAGSWSTTRLLRGRFMSEYGYQAWPSFASVKAISEPEDWSPFSNFSMTRNHHPGGPQQLWNEVMYYFKPPSQTSDNATYYANFIYLTQINQAMSIKFESEFYRRSQSSVFADGNGHTMGAMYWQLNDIWQAPTWASLEYSGKWKMLHYYAEQFFAPAALSMDVEDGKLVVYLMQDRIGAAKPTVLSLQAFSWTDNTSPIGVKNVNVSQVALKSQQIFGAPVNDTLVELGCSAAERCFLVARTDDERARETFFLPSEPKNAVGLQRSIIKVDQVFASAPRTFEVHLSSSAPAPFVWLEASVSGRFSKNGHLLYSAEDVVTFFAWEDITAAQVQAGLSVMSLMDIYSN